MNGSLVAASVGSPFTLYKGSKPFTAVIIKFPTLFRSVSKQLIINVFAPIKLFSHSCRLSPNCWAITFCCQWACYFCRTRGVYFDSYNWFNDSLQLYLQQAKSKNQIQNFNKSLPLETPFILNQTAVMLYQQTYNMYYANLDNSLYYGAACLGYWLLMLLVIGLVNWTKVLFPNFVKKLTSPIVNKWRKYISAPATFKRKGRRATIIQDCFSFNPFKV